MQSLKNCGTMVPFCQRIFKNKKNYLWIKVDIVSNISVWFKWCEATKPLLSAIKRSSRAGNTRVFLSGIANVVGRFRAGLISPDQLVYQSKREKANNYFWQAMWGPSLRLRDHRSAVTVRFVRDWSVFVCLLWFTLWVLCGWTCWPPLVHCTQRRLVNFHPTIP